jgi:phosphatidylglycerophosphate synthase
MDDIASHRRVNRSLSAPWEGPLLAWLVRRCPASVTPDMLSAFGLGGALAAGAGYALARQGTGFIWLASAGLAINWLGDSLDGTLARFRHIERPRYGYFLDHYLDALSIVLVCGGLAMSGHVKVEFVLLAMSGYLLMNVLVHMKACVQGVFQISYLGAGPTEIRLALVAANTFVCLFGNPTLAFVPLTLCDAAILVNAIALFVTFTVSGAWTLLTLRSREGR